MEIINEANALKAVHYLLNLDLNAIAPKHDQDARSWIGDIKQTEYQVKQSLALQLTIEQSHASESIHQKLKSLAAKAKGMSCLLTPEARQQLTSYLLVDTYV